MRATGIGSLPGDDIAEAIKLSFGELEGQIPFLPELPNRGVWSSMVGRTLGLIDGLDADLVPEGWRLTGTSGAPSVDQRRARSRLSEDLDVLEELAQDYTGAFKVQIAGPWTLAAMVERPKGDKVLGDYGARRDLADALAEAAAAHAREVRKRVPGASLIVQIDEPALAMVANAGVPTASGWGTHRHVDRPELTSSLAVVLEAISSVDAEPWVHACAAETPWDLVVAAGARGLSLDTAMVTSADADTLSEVIESDRTLGLGAIPSLDAPLDERELIESLKRFLGRLGFEPEPLGDRLVLTPSCGLAGATPAYARKALALARTSALAL